MCDNAALDAACTSAKVCIDVVEYYPDPDPAMFNPAETPLSRGERLIKMARLADPCTWLDSNCNRLIGHINNVSFYKCLDLWQY